MDYSRRADLRRDHSKASRVADGGSRRAEIRVVENIKKVGAKIQVLFFGHVELLAQRQVQVLEDRRALGSYAGVSERARGSHAVGAAPRVHSRCQTVSVGGPKPMVDRLILDRQRLVVVRPRGAPAHGLIGLIDRQNRDWKSGVHADDGIQLPATHDQVLGAVHTATEPPAFPDRKLPDGTEAEDVPRVKERRSVIAVAIVRVLPVGRFRGDST